MYCGLRGYSGYSEELNKMSSVCVCVIFRLSMISFLLIVLWLTSLLIRNSWGYLIRNGIHFMCEEHHFMFRFDVYNIRKYYGLVFTILIKIYMTKKKAFSYCSYWNKHAPFFNGHIEVIIQNVHYDFHSLQCKATLEIE